ncbi:MAG: DUF58 domain-containing protein [Dongiaceae bacterium]
MANPTERRARAEALASRLPPLLVAARQVAATVEQGIHGRRRVGIGETFWQFRRYEPGDSPTRIDWRQTAKSDRVYVREHEWAAAQTIWLWRDASPSMRFTSDPRRHDKRDHASILILALAAMLVRAGERIGLLGSDMRPAAGTSALDRLVFELDRLETAEDCLRPFRPLPRLAPLVLVGVFLSPLEAIDRRLREFAGGNRTGHLVQLLDPAEEGLPYHGRVRFEGMEGEGEMLASRAEALRPEYETRLQAHEQGLADIARAIGWSFTRAHTDRPPHLTLVALYALLAEAHG